MAVDIATQLLLMRVQLYAAAQLLGGEQLAEFKQLIREIAMTLEIIPYGDPRSDG